VSNKEQIKNLITEAFQQVLTNNIDSIKGEVFFDIIKKEIPYFSKYKLKEYKINEDDNSEIWCFEREHVFVGMYSKFKFIAKIKHHYNNNIWHFRMRVRGNLKQNGELDINTRNGFKELKTLLNNKLSANPIWKFDSFRNNICDVPNNEIIKQVKELLKNENKLSKLESKYFDDLKEILEIAKQYDLKTQQRDLIDKLLLVFDNCQESILGVLSKIISLDYYLSIEKNNIY
jgi:hypothetical protein